MFLGKRKGMQRVGNRLRTTAAFLLLLLYVAGNVQMENFHHVFHSIEKALHSSEQEKDPCHRAIYHDSEAQGCDHKTHVTEVKKCPLCHVVPFNEQHLAASHSFESISISNHFDEYIISISADRNSSNLSARAPPVC